MFEILLRRLLRRGTGSAKNERPAESPDLRACPLQIEGTIDGIAFYFRARGRRWTMGIGEEPADEPFWHLSRPLGKRAVRSGVDAGAIGRTIVEKCCELWRVARDPKERT